MTLVPSSLRFAIRALARRRAYTAMVVAILGLGIGANTAIFGVVDSVLLRSLPYDHPETLVVVFADGAARGQGARVATTAADFIDWRARADGFAGLAALRNESRRITTVDTPIVPLVHAVSANYFDVLGSRPLLGRAFRAGEDEPGHDDVVMLSYGVWQSIFGGDRGVIGRAIGLDDRMHTVVGVMGPDFYSAHLFPVQPGLWVPSPFETARENRVTRDVVVYGRLAAGGTLASAQAGMRTVAAQLARAHPATNDRWSVSLVPLREHAVGGFMRTATIVLAAVGFVLLIACANVANLTLARGAERSGEVAIRTALGASRPRIVADLLIENLLLAALGGAAGAIIASLAIPALVHLIPPGAGVPFLDRVAVDGRVLVFTAVASLACALLSGLLPSRQVARLNVVDGLRRIGRGGIPASGRRWRDVLVAGEVALAVIVLASAALMWRTWTSLDEVPAGFRADGLVKLRTSLRGDVFNQPASRIAHFEELQRRLQAVPSIATVSAVSFEPPIPAVLVAAVRLRLPGQVADAASAPSAVSRTVLADYFETMAIPIVSGRGVGREDQRNSRRVAVISRTMARRYFPDVDPIGRSFSIDGAGASPIEIVGVAGDVMTAGVDPTPQPVFYLPYAQNPLAVMTVVMRVSRGDPAAVLREAERIAWSIAPSTNVYAVETMTQYLADLNWRARFAAVALGGFAILGIVLATVGLYAVVSYTVLQRRGEIGLRMALGAGARAVVAMILGDALRVVGVGIVAGNVASAVLTRSMRGLLYGVAPGDPATQAAVSFALVVLAVGACLAPAIAASRVDPQIALKQN